MATTTWQLYNISKEYGNKRALKSFNLELSPGIYALLGPNGAGKSTLMNILAGVLKPSSGEILVNKGKLKRKEYQSLISYLPQQFGCYDSFTGRDMLYYFAALKDVPFDEALKKNIRSLSRIFDLEADLDRRVREYSGGMRQRLGIMQAFLGDPQLIILDEPTAGLDPRQRLYFQKLLLKVGKSRIILLSTHILSDVEKVADRILIIKQGRLLAEIPGSSAAEDIYMKYFG